MAGLAFQLISLICRQGALAPSSMLLALEEGELVIEPSARDEAGRTLIEALRDEAGPEASVPPVLRHGVEALAGKLTSLGVEGDLGWSSKSVMRKPPEVVEYKEIERLLSLSPKAAIARAERLLLHANTPVEGGETLGVCLARMLFVQHLRKASDIDAGSVSRYTRLMEALVSRTPSFDDGCGVDGKDIGALMAAALFGAIPAQEWQKKTTGRAAVEDCRALLRASTGRAFGATMGEACQALLRVLARTRKNEAWEWVALMALDAASGVERATAVGRRSVHGADEATLRARVFWEALDHMRVIQPDGTGVRSKLVNFLKVDGGPPLPSDPGLAWWAVLVMGRGLGATSRDPHFILSNRMVGGQLARKLIEENIMPPLDDCAFVMTMFREHDGEPWQEKIKAELSRHGLDSLLDNARAGERRPRL